MFSFNNKEKCTMCRRKKNLMHFRVHIKEEEGYRQINDIHLCKRCGLKLFGKEAERIWSDK